MAEGSGRWRERERECERDCGIRHEESGRESKINDSNSL